MEPEDAHPTTETAMLEWAAGVESRLNDVAGAVAGIQDIVVVLAVVLFMHCLGSCFPQTRNSRSKQYKH